MSVDIVGRNNTVSNSGVNDVSCTSADYCAAAGYYTLAPSVCKPNPSNHTCTQTGGQTAAYLVTSR